MRRYFSLTTWGPVSDFPLIRLEFDWQLGGFDQYGDACKGWFGVIVSLLGYSANLSYWPSGKYLETTK